MGVGTSWSASFAGVGATSSCTSSIGSKRVISAGKGVSLLLAVTEESIGCGDSTECVTSVGAELEVGWSGFIA